MIRSIIDRSRTRLLTGPFAFLMLTGSLLLSTAATRAAGGIPRWSILPSVSGATASSCPTTWSQTDIGNAQPAGSASIRTIGTFLVSGGGRDAWGTSDQVHYLWRSVCKQTSISARFMSLTNTGVNAEAGLMFRASLAPDAPNYFLFVEPQEGGLIEVTARTAAGAATINIATALTGQTFPVYLRISRVGTTFSAYTSADAKTWTVVPGTTLTLNIGRMSPLLGGIAVSSFNTSTLATATFNHLSIVANTSTRVHLVSLMKQ